MRRPAVVPVLVVGVLGGLAGAAYLAALRLLQRGLWPEHHTGLTSLVLLTVVGLVIGLLTRWLGNPGDVEPLVDNIHVIGRPESARSLRSLIPVSLLGIAVGGATGPEAPLVQTTGTLGSTIALRTGRSADGLRILAITGMAAGFTVLFGTPLGAAIFALEILHRRGMEYYEALMPAIIGSLSGYVVSVLADSVGLAPIFDFPPTPALHEGHLGWAVVAGVVGALVATVFTYLVDGMRHLFSHVGLPLRPMLGGLGLGLLGLLVTPFALIFAEEQIDRMLAASLGIGTLALIAGTTPPASVSSPANANAADRYLTSRRPAVRARDRACIVPARLSIASLAGRSRTPCRARADHRRVRRGTAHRRIGAGLRPMAVRPTPLRAMPS